MTDTQTEGLEQKKAHKRRFVWLILWIVCFLLLAFSPFLLFLDTPLRISKETTYLTEPLTPDGTHVDFVRAIEERTYPPEMQTDDNGCRILTRAIGPPEEIANPEQSKQYYEKLGLAPTHTPTLKYVNEYKFIDHYFAANPDTVELWKEKYIEYRKSQDPDYEEETFNISGLDLGYHIINELKGRGFEPWQDWFKDVDPILDTLAEAVRKPKFVAPYTLIKKEGMLASIYMPESILYRNLARSLSLRIQHRVDNGNIDGAIDDIITCRRLGRHIQNQGMAFHYQIGIAIEGIGLYYGPNANKDVPMNAEQIRRMLREIEDLPPFRSIKETLETERLGRLAWLQGVAHSPKTQRREFFELTRMPMSRGTAGIPKWLQDSIDPYAYSYLLGYDWNLVLKGFNEASDQILDDVWVDPTFSENPMLWLSQGSRSRELAKVAAILAISGNLRVPKDELLCKDQMQRIALAMLLYEKEHGTLPPAFTVDGAVDSTVKPLHSWRVLILPYLGETEKKLFENIRLAEPWDSDWNKQFHETEIAVYTCPSEAEKPTFHEGGIEKGRTDYTVLVGEETPFAEQPTGVGRNSKDFGPNTILLAERTRAVCWMDPTQEITQSDAETFVDSTTLILGSTAHFRGSHFTFLSGGTTFIPQDRKLDEFRELIRGTAEKLP